jgi:predicted KAP-like P-loop ATPase
MIISSGVLYAKYENELRLKEKNQKILFLKDGVEKLNKEQEKLLEEKERILVEIKK